MSRTTAQQLEDRLNNELAQHVADLLATIPQLHEAFTRAEFDRLRGIADRVLSASARASDHAKQLATLATRRGV